MKKILLIVIDGLGDEPIPQLGKKTPLEAARTPNLDFLAKNGLCGLVLPWTKRGKLPTSEDTHLALFGYDPKKYNPGRGVLEVLGVGMGILPGDVCLRGNFATVDREMRIIDRRAGRIETTENLIRVINRIEIEGVKFLIGKAVSHRIGIIIRGKDLSPKISDNDPKIIGIPPKKIKPLDESKKAKFIAKILNQFLEKSHLILKNHPFNKKRKLPANYILVRGAGKLRKIECFEKKWKLKSAFIAAGALYKGIGRFLGMEEIRVKGDTGLPNTNLKGKITAAKNGLKNLAPYRPPLCEWEAGVGYDFIFCHIKPADNFAEDGDFWGKKKFIEKIDKSLRPLLSLKNRLIVVTGDHATCSLRKSHCNLPNPILIFGKEKNNIKKFSEKACQLGKLGRIKQLNLMSKILQLAKNRL